MGFWLDLHQRFNQSGLLCVCQENLWVWMLRFDLLELGLVVGFMGLAFGWNLGLGVLLFVGDWIWGRTPRKTQRTWTCYSEKIMKGIKKEWHLINLFHVDIFGYKESTRKAK